MKALVFGARGFLGSAFLSAFPEWIGSIVDIADRSALNEELSQHRPDVVINCAGKTGRPNIDWCEHNKLETARSNIAGPVILLGECLRRDIRLVHIGSGCIFQGDNKGHGFAEHDPPTYGCSFYSRTKLLAYEALADSPVLILRLRMPFDDKSHPRNLINKLATYRRVLDVQNSLTYLPEFIEATRRLINQRATGVYHVVNPGTISPYELMMRYKEMIDPCHQCTRLTGDQLAEVTTAPRSNCVLSTRKLESAGITLTNVHCAVDKALLAILAETKEQDAKNLLSSVSPARALQA